MLTLLIFSLFPVSSKMYKFSYLRHFPKNSLNIFFSLKFF
nr:MAG TPA: hypothetical protein [Caudoviricetes sp.]DAX52644.1 MAG TPA: hypothetical protein [Caudoviricetes sp.]